ncbi:hypothetical protein SAMD00019534_005200, partial [Acytostelium subglobosum LB1]|uniref:hypothetical protein n=1 Tax=Acytostelium subglobosum LB1 TaxID=1410327 RepID=UPI000644AD19
MMDITYKRVAHNGRMVLQLFLLMMSLQRYIGGVGLANGMTYQDQDITFTGHTYLISRFGFNSGGSFQINATINSPMPMSMSNFNNNNVAGSTGGINFGFITLWVCQDNDYQSLIGSSSDSDVESHLCGNPAAGECVVRNMTIGQSFSYSDTITTSDLYRFILLKCNSSNSVDMTLDYQFINPGGHHLSRGSIQLVSLYLSTIILLSILLTFYILYCLLHRQHVNFIHHVIGFVVLLRLILVMLTYIYYNIADSEGYFNVPIKYMVNLFFSFAESVFFGALLLLSKGWKITRATISVGETRMIGVIMIMLISVLLFFSFYNDIYYFLSLMILYFFMMPKLFTNFTKNLRKLERHITLARLTGNARSSIICNTKKKAFIYLRSAVIVYLGGILLTNSMRIIMVWFLYWTTFCVSEPMTILMLGFLCVTFRPFRSNTIFIGSNMDHINIDDITRSIAELTGSNELDPLTVSSLLDVNSFNANSCIIVQYPGDRAPSVGVSESAIALSARTNINNKLR